MKFNLTVLFSLLPAALAYMDTASFYSSESLDVSGQHYIVESTSLHGAMNALTKGACSGSAKKLTVYRVSNLGHAKVDNAEFFAKHVHYKGAEALDLPISNICTKEQVKYVTSTDELDEESDSPVVIVDLENISSSADMLKSDRAVIIQGVPSFHSPESKLESVKHYIEDKAQENFNLPLDFDQVLKKRDTPTKYEDEEFDKLVSEVEDDFRAAESYIAQEGSDMPVHALTDASDAPIASVAGNYTKPSHSSLFTKYEYFTPGIFQTLLVSWILISVLYIALSWISSIEITYKSFDKQVDFEKKTE
ncbi:hypothetical protein CAAN1_04S08020 [[Candida] anglica]|uniref:Protein BIG1 n=1 Tax=[Candida] anglica TaxID=148631 RepID=A0ABP0E8D1_9ASCO